METRQHARRIEIERLVADLVAPNHTSPIRREIARDLMLALAAGIDAAVFISEAQDELLARCEYCLQHMPDRISRFCSQHCAEQGANNV